LFDQDAAISGLTAETGGLFTREREMDQQNDLGWLLQIYEVSDRSCQEILCGLLSGLPRVTVEGQSTSAEDFLIVDCADSTQAPTVFRLVTSVDYEARLVHTTNGPRPSLPSAA
jgi:hypothetical protein